MKKYILLFLIFVFFLSCKDEKNIIETDDNNKINYLLTLQGSADAFLIADRLKIKSLEGQNYSYKYQNSSYFFDGFGNNVIVDEVNLNGVTLNQEIDSSDSGFDHTNKHIWEISDNNIFSNFSDTINQKLDFTITYPNSISDTLSKSNGFTINYSVAGDCDSLLIMINSQNLISHYKIDSTINKFSTNISFYKIVNNNGSAFISSNELNQFISNRILSIDVIGLVHSKKTTNNKEILKASVIRNKSYCYLGV